MLKKIKFSTLLAGAVLVSVGLSVSFQSLLAAWSPPTAVPPNGNAEAPLNTSSALQLKNGPLMVNGTFDVTGTGNVATFAGNVGIGTASTGAYRLNVQGGQVNVSGGLCIAGDCKASWAQVTGTVGNADTVDGLHVHGGRNNEANKLVRTDASGYIQAGYINSSNGDEGNNASPARVWGTNGSDSYLRTYLTSALSVGYASNADMVDSRHVGSGAGNIPYYNNTNGYLYLPTWMNVDGGGIYSGTNGAHFSPNGSSLYGAWRITGARNTWSGISFNTGSSNAGTLMMHPSYSGFYNAADNNWRWYTDNSGNTQNIGNLAVGGSISSNGASICYGGSCMSPKWETGNFGLDSYGTASGCNYWVAGAGQQQCNTDLAAAYTCAVSLDTIASYPNAPNYGQCIDIYQDDVGCPYFDGSVYNRRYRWITCQRERRATWNEGGSIRY